MFKSIRTLAVAALILPVALPLSAAQVNTSLPAKVQKALAANKISANSLSLVTLPLTGSGAQTLVNADVSVNPASTMKLITTYAALELLGPTHQWRTEFYGDGPLKNGVLHGNLYLKGGGDPKLNMEKLWLMMRDLRANGVQQISGDLVLDRSHFNQPQLPSFNDDGGDPNKPFLVGPDSLLVNLKAVRMITLAPALAWGFADRGLLREGMAADINVFDPATVAPAVPEVVYDLPAGGKRLEQRAVGFAATLVNGVVTIRDGVPTGDHPGRLLRNRLASR